MPLPFDAGARQLFRAGVCGVEVEAARANGGGEASGVRSFGDAHALAGRWTLPSITPLLSVSNSVCTERAAACTLLKNRRKEDMPGRSLITAAQKSLRMSATHFLRSPLILEDGGVEQLADFGHFLGVLSPII